MQYVIINAKFDGNEIFWKFTKSETGTIDYAGPLLESVNLENYQCLNPSLYFTPSDYLFLQGVLQAKTKIAFSPDYSMPSRSEFAFFVHIASVLLAMEADDTFLVGELLSRNSRVFEKFANIVLYVVESKIVEIFFSQMYGTFYASPDSYGDLRFLTEPFEKKLGLKLKTESLDEAFIRYFQANKAKGQISFSMPIVGMNFGSWDAGSRILNKMLNHLEPRNLDEQAAVFRKTKHDFYSALEVVAQIEPYNKADKNAIVIMIDDIAAKMSGCEGKSKAGYLRRTGAEIIRIARPELMSFDAKLLRIYHNGEVVIGLSL